MAGCHPVAANAVSQLNDVTLKIQFIFLQPRDVELFTRCSTFELPGNILFIVSNNSKRSSVHMSLRREDSVLCNDAGCAHTFSPLSDEEFSLFFD